MVLVGPMHILKDYCLLMEMNIKETQFFPCGIVFEHLLRQCTKIRNCNLYGFSKSQMQCPMSALPINASLKA